MKGTRPLMVIVRIREQKGEFFGTTDYPGFPRIIKNSRERIRMAGVNSKQPKNGTASVAIHAERPATEAQRVSRGAQENGMTKVA
jgi:hypothetical protein